MQNQQQTAVAHLKHALVFVQLAKAAEWPIRYWMLSIFRPRKARGMRQIQRQHLDEAERLIDYAKGLLEAPHGIPE